TAAVTSRSGMRAAAPSRFLSAAPRKSSRRPTRSFVRPHCRRQRGSTTRCMRGRETAMAQYVLRDIPDDQWERFKSKARTDGWPLRALVLELMKDYADARLRPHRRAPMQKYGALTPFYIQLIREHPEILHFDDHTIWGNLQNFVVTHAD